MRYHAAAIQTAFDCPRDRSEIAARVDRMCAMVEQTVAGYEPFFDVRLFAFPEFAHAAPVYTTVAELRKHLAVPVPNEHIDKYLKVCQKLGVFIQTGTFLEAPADRDDVVYNTTVLCGPGGVRSIYRKVNPWIPWEVHASPHDVGADPSTMFPVAQTEIDSQVVDERLAILGTEVAGLLVFDDMPPDLPVGFDQLGVDGLHRPNPSLGIGVRDLFQQLPVAVGVGQFHMLFRCFSTRVASVPVPR